MIIDSHNHVHYGDKDPAAVIAEMDAIGIDVTWLLTWNLVPAEDAIHYHAATSPMRLRGDGTHAAITLTDVVEACRAYPGRFIPGYCPPPWHPRAPHMFEQAYHMHGVRICGEWSYRMVLDDPRAINLFRTAGRLRCPVILHMDSPCLPPEKGTAGYQQSWYAGTIENLERALQAVPETTFVGHCPAFWREISGDADQRPEAYPTGPITPGGRIHRMLDQYPNLWADLSAGSAMNAMKRDVELGRQFILRHADRLMYGRDQHGNAHQEFLNSLGLPDSVLRKIYCENALRLVPLKR